MSDITPYYSFRSELLPQQNRREQPGMYQGVMFTIDPAHLEGIIGKIESWFADRDEITLIDYGLSDKQGTGVIILEWTDYEIDPLFLAILRDEELVIDYVVYNRPEDM
jgi:hypothetical protein